MCEVCFISLQLSILHPSWRRVCAGRRRFQFGHVGWPNLTIPWTQPSQLVQAALSQVRTLPNFSSHHLAKGSEIMACQNNENTDDRSRNDADFKYSERHRKQVDNNEYV